MTAKKPGASTTKTTPSAAEGAPLRGEALVRAAIAAARESGRIASPDPVPAKLLARLRLPNGEELPASLRALLAFDGAWLGMGIDVEDAELELLDLEDLIALGPERVAAGLEDDGPGELELLALELEGEAEAGLRLLGGLACCHDGTPSTRWGWSGPGGRRLSRPPGPCVTPR